MILQRTHFLSFGEELQFPLLEFVVVRAITWRCYSEVRCTCPFRRTHRELIVRSVIEL
jgi:hypothetical protein